MKNLRIQIGDIYEISLQEGKRAFVQYLHTSQRRGQLVQVFKIIIDENSSIDIQTIISSGLLFPPILTSVSAALNTKQWKKIGNLPIKLEKYPQFVSTFYDKKTGKARKWFLITENEDLLIGDVLPEKFHDFEFLAIYSPDLIAKRIISGKKPYDSLIRTNVLTEDPTKS